MRASKSIYHPQGNADLFYSVEDWLDSFGDGTGSVTVASVTLANGGSLRTGTTAGNTALLQAYDTDTGPAYTTFATLTAGTTPSLDLADTVTKATKYIYRADGTDVPVADGGTGVSSLTAYAVMCGGTTSTGAVQSIAGVGSAGQVLTSNGAGALPTFQAVSGGMSLLNSGTVSSAATLDIVLTSYTAYKSLLFVLSGFRPATDGDTFSIRFSTDGGSTYDASGYNSAGLYVRDSSPTATPIVSASTNAIYFGVNDVGSASTEGMNIDVRLCNQTSTAFWSRVTYSAYYVSSAATPAGIWVIGGGAREAAQDTDAVRFLFATGNIASGNWAVYGLA